MNRSELRERVKILLRDDVTDPAQDSNLIGNSALNDIIEERRQELYAHLSTLFPNRFIDVDDTLTYSSGSASEDLPAGVQGARITNVRMRAANQTAPYEYRTLKMVSLEESTGYDAVGTPILVSRQGMTKVRLRPVPDADYILEFFYVPALTGLTDNDEPTEIPNMFHHVIAYSAAVRVKQMVDDPPGALDVAYQEALSKLVSFIGAMADDHGLEGVGY